MPCSALIVPTPETLVYKDYILAVSIHHILYWEQKRKVIFQYFDINYLYLENEDTIARVRR